MTQSTETATEKYIKIPSNYDRFPFIKVTDSSADCTCGWAPILDRIKDALKKKNQSKSTLVVETYPGIDHQEILNILVEKFKPVSVVDTLNLFLPESTLREKMTPFLGDHPIFGKLNDLSLSDYFDRTKIKQLNDNMNQEDAGIHLIFGPGARQISENPTIVIYADMARWEIQQRMRRQEVANLGFSNHQEKASLLYKQAYFIDWRVADKEKMRVLPSADFLLDTTDRDFPKLISVSHYHEGLKKALTQPFRVVPFFDPGVWGGQWMKEVCNLDKDEINYAWCFDCVPEENSLLLGFGDHRVEIPALNLVLTHPGELLGENVFRTFGAEFPIRFDFLDTMDGGNLSLQVHPLKKYIKEEFGLDYTQDESYYLLDAEDDAIVYLGLKEGIDRKQMEEDLIRAEKGDFFFDADKYVNQWPVRKHDHVLIPAGTIHCSGKNSMVLEISATPYIFTFKLWDWGRVDLNGLPRTISLEHGLKNIQWDRDTAWTKEQLINKIDPVSEGDGWREEKTGLHDLEFIETRRHWFTKSVPHDTGGNLNVLNLIEGREVLVESPDQKFEPFIVHYAETFIVPATVGKYTIRPYGESEGQQCATIKAFVRRFG